MSDSESKIAGMWEERWARFSMGLMGQGVVTKKQEFFVAWGEEVLGIH